MSHVQLVAWLAVATAVALGGSGDRSTQEIAAADGSRVQPLPPGQGGDLVVTAPAELCLDDGYELQIRRLVQGESGPGLLSVLRNAAGPSLCRWDVNGLQSAAYDAVIRRRADDQIVAVAPKASVAVGGLSELRLEIVRVEVEGTITVNGRPTSNLQLFVGTDDGFNDWRVPLREDGSYSVALPGSDGSAHFCIRLLSTRVQPIGGVFVGCQSFATGLNHFDTDVHIPPGVIRVEVLPMGEPVSNDWTSLIVVVGDYVASSGSFKATGGFHGEYLGAKLGQYIVSVQTVPDHRILSRSTVVLSRDHPVGEVRLTIPMGSLGCKDGWWNAC